MKIYICLLTYKTAKSHLFLDLCVGSYFFVGGDGVSCVLNLYKKVWIDLMRILYYFWLILDFQLNDLYFWRRVKRVLLLILNFLIICLSKTTDKSIKWIICFSSMLLNVFFDKTTYRYSPNKRKLDNPYSPYYNWIRRFTKSLVSKIIISVAKFLIFGYFHT